MAHRCSPQPRQHCVPGADGRIPRRTAAVPRPEGYGLLLGPPPAFFPPRPRLSRPAAHSAGKAGTAAGGAALRSTAGRRRSRRRPAAVSFSGFCRPGPHPSAGRASGVTPLRAIR